MTRGLDHPRHIIFAYHLTPYLIMKLLIADDNSAVRSSLKLLLAGTFDRIITTADPRLIPAMLAEGDVDAVLLDMNFDPAGELDGADGLFWLSRIMEMEPHPAVVVITAFGDVALAVEAMKIGASDFVTKPWDNDDLKAKLRRAIADNRKRRDDRDLLAEAQELRSAAATKSRMTLDELKASHIKEVIDDCGGNLSLAATRLGINRQTLYNQLRKQS